MALTEEQAKEVRRLLDMGYTYEAARASVAEQASLARFGFGEVIRQQNTLRARKVMPPSQTFLTAQRQRHLTAGRPGRPPFPRWENPPATWRADARSLQHVRNNVIVVRTEEEARKKVRDIQLIVSQAKAAKDPVGAVHAWQWGLVMLNEWLHGKMEAQRREVFRNPHSQPSPADRSIRRGPVTPAYEGADVSGEEYDAHVRLEDVPDAGPRIAVDVFRSAVSDPTMAHQASEFFPVTAQGKRGATEFLHSYNIAVEVV